MVKQHHHPPQPDGDAAGEAANTKVVRGAGLEPAQYCYRQDLNLVRLPISPPARLKQKWEYGLPREHSKPCRTPAEIG
jgi:hypothetical protein